MYKVIVCIPTYNLEKYVSQALDSVLMQKTNFDFKIRIGDDCSTDKTLAILSEYQNRFPDKIEVLTHDKNQGNLVNLMRLFDGIQCEYFTLLDGDDYWISDTSLQKQVDFLDSHPEYTMCAGNTQYMRDDILSDYIMSEDCLNKTYSFKEIDNMPFFHTSATLLRNVIYKDGMPQCYKDVVNTFENGAVRGEDFRRYTHLEKGPVYIMDEIFSVYRIHENGIWQGATSNFRTVDGAIRLHYFYKYFGERCGDFFKKRVIAFFRASTFQILIDSIETGNLGGEKENVLYANLLHDIIVHDTPVFNNKLPKYKRKLVILLLKIVKRILRKNT